MTINANGIVRTLERKPGIATARPARYTGLRKAAESLSRRNADAAVCELMNEALQRLAALCYETDAGGLCNIDPVTGKLLIPTPWGRNGHARWGLRPQEANILRRILFDRQPYMGLFVYERSRRAWRVNLYDYPTLTDAAAYLAQHPVDIAAYRAARDKLLGDG